jgi:hypothetical protein
MDPYFAAAMIEFAARAFNLRKDNRSDELAYHGVPFNISFFREENQSMHRTVGNLTYLSHTTVTVLVTQLGNASAGVECTFNVTLPDTDLLTTTPETLTDVLRLMFKEQILQAEALRGERYGGRREKVRVGKCNIKCTFNTCRSISKLCHQNSNGSMAKISKVANCAMH